MVLCTITFLPSNAAPLPLNTHTRTRAPGDRPTAADADLAD